MSSGKNKYPLIWLIHWQISALLNIFPGSELLISPKKPSNAPQVLSTMCGNIAYLQTYRVEFCLQVGYRNPSVSSKAVKGICEHALLPTPSLSSPLVKYGPTAQSGSSPAPLSVPRPTHLSALPVQACLSAVSQ